MSRPGDEPPRLEACGVAKHFGGVKALDDVHLDVPPARSTPSAARTARASQP